MINILVIEDDSEKLRNVIKVLSSIEFNNCNTEYVLCANDAKRRMIDTHYDMAILDINLPLTISDDPQSLLGVELLKELIGRPELYKMPTHIVGLTAYEDEFDAALPEFEIGLFSIIKYKNNSDEWQRQLINKIDTINASLDAMDDVENYKTDVAIMCALLDTELGAMLDNGWKWERCMTSEDSNTYFKTNIDTPYGNKSIVASSCSRMGPTFSAITATKLINKYRPRYLIMPGIAAGKEVDTKLGDILVPDPVWDWGAGKWVEENGERSFEPDPYQYQLDPIIRNKITQLSRNTELLRSIKDSWRGECPDTGITIHTGPVASGSAVLADGQTFNQIHSQPIEI